MVLGLRDCPCGEALSEDQRDCPKCGKRNAFWKGPRLAFLLEPGIWTGGGMALAGYAFMMTFQDPPPGRKVAFGVFQIVTGALGLAFLGAGDLLRRRKGPQ